jgi:hypothetical protein
MANGSAGSDRGPGRRPTRPVRALRPEEKDRQPTTVTAADSGSSFDPSEHDQQAMERTIEALRQRFPGVAAEDIADQVRAAYQRYQDAPIREYVPVMVEREVRLLLRSRQA